MNHEQQLFSRLAAFSPFWMGEPDAWVWSKPDGTAQGFGMTWRKERDGAGMANLLWLSMDLDRRPRQYDARSNPLYTIITMFGHEMYLDRLALFDVAGSTTVEQFHAACLRGTFEARPPIQNILPVLTLLAARRVQHAHP